MLAGFNEGSVPCPSRSCVGGEGVGTLYICIPGLKGVVSLGAICLSHRPAAH